MRITLISTSNKQDKGPRIIASFLEKNKHQVEILYSPEKPNCKDSGLIVVSANVSTCKKASKIIKALKKLNKPIVYAGIYPSLYPAEAIKETDLVIFKNPKETILELANRLENFQKIVPDLMGIIKLKKEETKVELHKGERVYRRFDKMYQKT